MLIDTPFMSEYKRQEAREALIRARAMSTGFIAGCFFIGFLFIFFNCLLVK